MKRSGIKEHQFSLSNYPAPALRRLLMTDN